MISEQRRQQLRDNFLGSGDVRCIYCYSTEVIGSVIVDPGGNEEVRRELCIPPQSVLCFGLCVDCWDMDEEDILETVALRITPEENRN